MRSRARAIAKLSDVGSWLPSINQLDLAHARSFSHRNEAEGHRSESRLAAPDDGSPPLRGKSDRTRARSGTFGYRPPPGIPRPRVLPQANTHVEERQCRLTHFVRARPPTPVPSSSSPVKVPSPRCTPRTLQRDQMAAVPLDRHHGMRPSPNGKVEVSRLCLSDPEFLSSRLDPLDRAHGHSLDRPIRLRHRSQTLPSDLSRRLRRSRRRILPASRPLRLRVLVKNPGQLRTATSGEEKARPRLEKPMATIRAGQSGERGAKSTSGRDPVGNSSTRAPTRTFARWRRPRPLRQRG